MAFKLLVAFVLLAIPLNGYGPWGRDAELTSPCQPNSPCCKTPLQRIGARLIDIHHCYISKADGPRSHFYPSSSHYTQEAICKYGFMRGYLMGCDRLMRENGEAWVYPTVCVDGSCLKVDCP